MNLWNNGLHSRARYYRYPINTQLRKRFGQVWFKASNPADPEGWRVMGITGYSQVTTPQTQCIPTNYQLFTVPHTDHMPNTSKWSMTLTLYIYIYLGLQKIKKFWSTPSVLLFPDANSKSSRFGRYLQKPVVSFMPSTATLIFFLSFPDPLNWL